MEAVFIQRSPRELATYALVRLRLEAMPELCAVCRSGPWPPAEGQGLIPWARTQGAGGAMLANVLQQEVDQTVPSPRGLAALSSLKYYHCRDADNPAVKSSWTEDGFERLAALNIDSVLDYPIAGNFWRSKFDTVRCLVASVRRTDFSPMADAAVLRALESLAGVGEQTASMVALFWLERPIPILDTYLLRLLRDHGLLPASFSLNTVNRSHLRRHLLEGAIAIETYRPEWLAPRVLACLYLWACEVGRLHCRCQTSGWPACPMRSMH